MTQILEAGKRIQKLLANQTLVDVSASFMSYDQAREIAIAQNLICNYWVPNKVFVFQKAVGMAKSQPRITLHVEHRI